MRTAQVPKIDILSNADVQKIINDKAPEFLKKSPWEKLRNVSRACDGTTGQLGYQKTNDDAIDVPLIYLTEVHVFKNVDNKNQFKAVIITVQVDERTGKPRVNTAETKIIDGNSFNVGADTFNSTLMLANGNVVKFGGWFSLDDVVAARNAELVEQSKFTQEQIDEMMAIDGYVHPL